MATELLYYNDPYIQTFEATVVRNGMDGDNSYVVLDQTAFYPTGGGQPADRGTLNDVKVYSAEKKEREIWHYVGEILPVGTKIIGKIDWQRRFDHMQQHCGQHILSAAFEEIYQLETVSFHLGTEIVTIDLKTESVTQEVLDQVEKKANEVIISNLPIEVKWITEGELGNYPLRKKPTVSENIRLVIIPDFDYNGCGGTHPTRTGEVGLIKIFGWEKNRGNIRLQFACGFRALKELHDRQMYLKEITTLLHTSPNEAPSKLIQILDSQVALNKELDTLKLQLMESQIDDMVKDFTLHGSTKIIAYAYRGHTIKELQVMARKMVETNEKRIVLLVTENDNRLQMVFAASKEVEIKMNELLKTVLEMIDGKGGGKVDFAQGGGSAKMSAKEMINQIKSLIEQQL